ncbi:VTT domain-containing protein [Thiohalophilus sp.]|uniref:VTT domain-containing protein n=1 Tax=Thiohalophilus sp. TaxID=3028392 RepID=UPI002ACDCD9F|nr:VTT domain-containing protein [Thiohalophilus sp.]MDZ7662961.1 VTT domain-containing protein [Thiohalophilus sp.]
MKTKLIRLGLFAILVIAIGIAISYRDQFDAAALEAWLDGAGAAGPILFILIYAAAAVLFLPGSVLTLAGGALFGPVWGTLFNLIGATLGATLAFLIARYLAADWVERKTGGRLKQLKQGVEKEGWRFVAFVRLVPLFPFNLLNYALGLTRINLAHYIIASFICMFPGAVAYTYLGYAGREAIAGGEGLIQKILLAIGLLVLVAFLPRWIGRLRQGPSQTVDQLKQQLDQQADVLVLDVRSEEDFNGEQQHIPGARNVPLEELPNRLDELAEYQERSVVTVCRTDKRSAKAAQLLARQGFADVHIIKGGMTDWNEKGYPVA